MCYFNGTITASPIIETIANDITEYTLVIDKAIPDDVLVNHNGTFFQTLIN